MRAGLSFSRSSISLLLRQPLSIKKSHAGAIQLQKCIGHDKQKKMNTTQIFFSFHLLKTNYEAWGRFLRFV
jgi:hypothetical protein